MSSGGLKYEEEYSQEQVPGEGKLPPSMASAEWEMVLESLDQPPGCNEVFEGEFRVPDNDILPIPGQTVPSAACGRWAMLNLVTRAYYRWFCGCRNCPREVCRKRFHYRRIRLLQGVVDEHKLTRFFTLTLDPEMVPDGVDAWSYVSTVWSRMRHRLSRACGRSPKYIAVLEKHKQNDRPHIHGFIDHYLPWEEWRRHWEECGGGKGVYLEYMKEGDSAAEYVSKSLKVVKYVGKDNMIGVPPGVRTLWRSLGTKFSGELTKGRDWCIVKENIFTESGEVVHDVYPHVTDVPYVKYLTQVKECDNAKELMGEACGSVYAEGNEEGCAGGEADLDRKEGNDHYAEEASCEPKKKERRGKFSDKENDWKGLGKWLAYWNKVEELRSKDYAKENKQGRDSP